MKSEKKYYKFIILWIGSIIATVGTGMSAFAIGIYVYNLTNSASLKALTTLLAFIPNVFLAPFSGVLADKYDRRKLMVAGDLFSGLGVLLILLSIKFDFTSVLIIGLGVFISSVFSSTVEPASRATITDLVNEEDYTKASGLMQLSQAAKFILSPVIAASLMNKYDIEIIFILDILTIFITVGTVLYIKKDLDKEKKLLETVKEKKKEELNLKLEIKSIFESLKEGIRVLRSNKPLFILILISPIITFSLGFLEELSTPIALAFTDTQTFSYMLTISALGMVGGSVVLGFIKIKKNHLKILATSFTIAGFAMLGFGVFENIYTITAFGFIFFSLLPLINSLFDYLVRINVKNSAQGRIWGLISIISNLGYLISFVFIWAFADNIFAPLLVDGSFLGNTIGVIVGTGETRGLVIPVILCGTFLIIFSIYIRKSKLLRMIELESKKREVREKIRIKKAEKNKNKKNI